MHINCKLLAVVLFTSKEKELLEIYTIGSKLRLERDNLIKKTIVNYCVFYILDSVQGGVRFEPQKLSLSYHLNSYQTSN